MRLDTGASLTPDGLSCPTPAKTSGNLRRDVRITRFE
jgi:hypothetical protein